MFIQCAQPRKRGFKTFRKFDAAAVRWLKENKDRVISIAAKKYAGREYVFVNHYVS